MGALRWVGKRIIETVEERTGREIVPAGTSEVLESAASDSRVLRKTLEFIGYSLMNMQGPPQLGRMPSDISHIGRVQAAAQSQRAWIEDPMAGQQVDLYVSFVLGRGIPKASAADGEVQDSLDKAWADAANQRVLTSFEKLVEKAIDLCLSSNVFFTFFDDGEDGMVRCGRLKFENVVDVVRHPLDDDRILFYKVIERIERYNYREGRALPVTSHKPEERQRIVYFEAWGAFDDENPVMTAQDDAAGGREALSPPEGMLRPGKVVHLAVNKTSDMAFGVPRMRRMLRWWTAYNEVLESHVNRMKAMAAIYMKYTAKGATDRELDKLGRMAIGGRPSLFGSSQDVPAAPQVPGPVAGVLGVNESMDAEPFKIDSGAADVAQSLPQLRAQISGAFSPAYYGQDPGSLAGQQSVELPTLKFIELDQAAWERVLRTLGEAQIKAAIDAGDLDEWRDATEDELAQIDAAEQTGYPLSFEVGADGRVKRDLSFEISLPSPLKRAMGDLVSAAVETAAAVDPNGSNHELSRWLFGTILREAFDVDDPQRIVDQVLPRHMAQEAVIDPATGLPIEPPAADVATVTGADGKQHPVDNPGGAKVKSPQPEQRPVRESPRPRSRRHGVRRRALSTAFDEDVDVIAQRLLDRLGDPPASVNGNGAHA